MKENESKLTPGASDGGRLEKIWSREMALRALKKIFRVSIEGARVETRDECGVVTDVRYNPSAANAARAAVESANRMLGYTEPTETAGCCDVTVALGDAEAYSE